MRTHNNRLPILDIGLEAAGGARLRPLPPLPGAEKAEFKHTRFLWLKNPENLAQAEHTRLSALLRLNGPIVRAYLLKEDLRRFWSYRSTAWAGGHLLQWLWRASHSRLEPFKKLARMLRGHPTACWSGRNSG